MKITRIAVIANIQYSGVPLGTLDRRVKQTKANTNKRALIFINPMNECPIIKATIDKERLKSKAGMKGACFTK
jgi:hypothetical protein